jgi:hypothetical protein
MKALPIFILLTSLFLPVPGHAARRSPAARNAQKPTAKKPSQNVRLTTAQRQAAKDALKSLRKLNAAVEVGLNNAQYTDRLIDAKADIEENLTSLPNGALKQSIQSALRAYEDAGTVWKASFESKYVESYLISVRDIFVWYRIKVPPIAANTFPEVSDDFAKIDYVKVPMSKIWGFASKYIAQADFIIKA